MKVPRPGWVRQERYGGLKRAEFWATQGWENIKRGRNVHQTMKHRQWPEEALHEWLQEIPKRGR